MSSNVNNYFTIIIPTRERKDTLEYTIKTALAQDYNNFCVIVSDNFSNDGTRELVESIENSRLIYFNTGSRVSMSHNWEFALSKVNHGWVTILGDDDAILPGALNRVNEIINETGLLAIRSNGCSFRWPNLTGTGYGEISLSLKKGYKIVSSAIALKKALNGEINYNELPVLYNGGFVHYSLLEMTKGNSDTIIKSRIPDIYLGVAFSILTTKYVYSFEPLAINGASIHSGGTAFFGNPKKFSQDNSFLKFNSESNLSFHPKIPLMPNGMPVRSLNVLLYESFLQTSFLHNNNTPKVTPKQQLDVIMKNAGFHFDEVYQFALIFSKINSIDINEISYKKSNVGIPNSISIIFYKWFLYQFKRFKSLWSDSLGFNGTFANPISNVYDAATIVGLLKTMPIGGPYWQIKTLIRNFKNRK